MGEAEQRRQVVGAEFVDEIDTRGHMPPASILQQGIRIDRTAAADHDPDPLGGRCGRRHGSIRRGLAAHARGDAAPPCRCGGSPPPGTSGSQPGQLRVCGHGFALRRAEPLCTDRTFAFAERADRLE